MEGQWTLGALSNLTPVDLSWLYQPFLAFLAAMSALSLYSLLGRVIEPRGWRALGAFIAAQPNILVAYALAGGIKELSTSCFLLLSAALIARGAPAAHSRPHRARDPDRHSGDVRVSFARRRFRGSVCWRSALA